ncbi:MAG: inner membrane-spanning protein YciB [Pseudomonadales bacterium]|jgi:intracellular septation protein
MNALLDLLPIAIFAAVFFASDIYVATAALMLAVTAQVAIVKLLRRPLSRELLLTFWMSIIFGSMTLIFHNEIFIQWKPTIVNGLLGLSLIGSQYVGKHNLLRRLLGAQLDLPDPIWTRLNLGWAFGFLFAAVLNLVVAYSFSMSFWVTYKLVGGFALTLTYVIATLAYLSSKGLLTADSIVAQRTERS